MNAQVGKAPRPDFVPMSSELRRIERLRRRVMAPEDLQWLADEMTVRLKKPRGTMRLKPVQAWALYELGTIGGLFAPITVGGGKTLISLLAPIVMRSHRPLLIVPAGLVEKTKRDKEVLEQHWHLPLFIRIMSYEWLGRVQAGADPATGRKGALEEWDPDLIVLDECHRAKNNRNAAVARRITRFFRDQKKNKRALVVGANGHRNEVRELHAAALSGTVTKRSILDYAHILTWCLPAQLLPIPTHWHDLAMWSEALDEKKGDFAPMDPGALEILCVDDADRELWKTDRQTAARKTFRRRLVETPGVVATHETQVDASIVVRGLKCDVGPAVDAAFDHLRSHWETPDGWTIPDGMTLARHARELSLGFFYVWDPRPPVEWEMPRKAWHAFVRKVLKHSRTLDSELAVRKSVASDLEPKLPEQWRACMRELLLPPADRKKRVLGTEQRVEYSAQLVAVVGALTKDEDELEGWVSGLQWKGVQDTFVPNTRPVWIDASACEFAAKWADKNVGILWSEHKCVGERLRDEFGLSYYGRKGLDVSGKFIDNHDTKSSLVASRPANSEGRNLQGWNKNFILSLLPNGARNEQLLGRTHRPGQFADEVTFEFLVSCREHLEALDQATNDARYIEHSTGSPQKLLLATHDVDHRALAGFGPRWRSNDGNPND